eukprot:scaffold68100_cov18-Tisochrysis_lutea.AAC.1
MHHGPFNQACLHCARLTIAVAYGCWGVDAALRCPKTIYWHAQSCLMHDAWWQATTHAHLLTSVTGSH